MSHVKHSVASRAALLVAISSILLSIAVAQIGGGSIRGFVTDASGASVPNVQVTALNLDTNVRNTSTTNDSGYYEFPLLPAAKYQVEVTHEGFRPARSAAFTLSTGTAPHIDLTMDVGATSTPSRSPHRRQ